MDLKNFIKRPLFTVTGKLSGIINNFHNKLARKYAEQEFEKKEKLWNDLFQGKNFFEFTLKNKAKINLYKDSILSKYIYEGFEEDETNYAVSILKDGDIFIDVGANIGLFTLFASEVVGEEGKVICFEPSPSTFLRLSENVNLNEFKNIDLRNIGLSDKKEELIFYVSENGNDAYNSFAPSQDDKLEKSIKVPVSTLDFELNDVDKSSIKLIKIDVEGWEKFVLNGGVDFLKNYNPIVMVEFTEENTFNAGYPVLEIFDIMQKFGYSWYRIIEGELVLEKKKMSYPYVNLIAVKNN